jgi:hypothetical protein
VWVGDPCRIVRRARQRIGGGGGGAGGVPTHVSAHLEEEEERGAYQHMSQHTWYLYNFGHKGCRYIYLSLQKRRRGERMYTCNPRKTLDGAKNTSKNSDRWPSVFGRNTQCQPVRRVNTRDWAERNVIGRTRGSASNGAKGVKLNGILECKFPSENPHRI